MPPPGKRQKQLQSFQTQKKEEGGAGHLDMLRRQKARVQELESRLQQIQAENDTLGNQVSIRNSRIVELMNTKNEMLNLNMWEFYEGLNKIRQLQEYQATSQKMLAESQDLQLRLAQEKQCQDMVVLTLTDQIMELKRQQKNVKIANGKLAHARDERKQATSHANSCTCHEGYSAMKDINIRNRTKHRQRAGIKKEHVSENCIMRYVPR